MKVRVTLLPALLALSFLTIACGAGREADGIRPAADTGGGAPTRGGVSAAAAESIPWTEAELRRLAALRKTGLSIATTESLAIYEPRAGGEAGGVQYLLVKGMAEFLGLPLRLRTVAFPDYFALKGKLPARVKTDPAFRYTPDLFGRGVDLYVDTITVLPWREKLLDFIPVFPTRLVAVTRKGEELSDRAALAGKRISIIPGTASEDALLALEGEIGTTLDIIRVQEVQDEARMVAEGRSDVTVQDANVAILHLKEWKNLSISLNLSEKQSLAWAASPQDPVLASLVRKYLKHAEDRGILDRLWRDYYGITLLDYMWLIAD